MGNDQEFTEMVQFVRENKIVPIIDSLAPLEMAESAFNKMRDGRQFGKLVLVIWAIGLSGTMWTALGGFFYVVAATEAPIGWIFSSLLIVPCVLLLYENTYYPISDIKSLDC